MDARHHSLGFASLTCLTDPFSPCFSIFFLAPQTQTGVIFGVPFFLGVPNTGGSTILSELRQAWEGIDPQISTRLCGTSPSLCTKLQGVFLDVFLLSQVAKKHTILLGGKPFFSNHSGPKNNSGVTFHRVEWDLRSFTLWFSCSSWLSFAVSWYRYGLMIYHDMIIYDDLWCSMITVFVLGYIYLIWWKDKTCKNDKNRGCELQPAEGLDDWKMTRFSSFFCRRTILGPQV